MPFAFVSVCRGVFLSGRIIFIEMYSNAIVQRKKTYRASDKMLIPFSVGRRGFIKGTIGDGTVSPIACPLCSVEE